MSRGKAVKAARALAGASFTCSHCGAVVQAAAPGTHQRNHCPNCLHSAHVDIKPGDRLNPCRGLMKPVGIWVKPDGEWSILHRCERCGSIRPNRLSGDDDERFLMQLALKPVRSTAFPLP